MKINKASLKVNYLREPFIDTMPHFSFTVSSDDAGETLAAYRIEVSENPDFSSPVWDSGEIFSGEMCGIEYKGAKLKPRTRYYYKVTVRGRIDTKEKCETSFFNTAMLGEEWRARWITGFYCRRCASFTDAPLLRREFLCKDKVKSAVLYICGLGYFEAKINGEKVGDDFLSTPYTAYDKSVKYRAFDVSDMLSDKNAITVLLGNGFYNSFTIDPWQSATAPWRDSPKLLCELHIKYVNGKKETICSDVSWMSVHSPITFNGIRHGEIYDARLEENCEKYGFESECPESWKNAIIARRPGGKLSVSEAEPVKILTKTKAISMRKSADGYIFDMGKSTAGVCDILYRGKAGDEITVRYSDILKSDGELDMSLGTFIKNHFFQTEKYIKKSDKPELHSTRFSYYGFRYVEISGGDIPELSDVTALSYRSDFDARGHFSCSDEMINTVQNMCLQSTNSCAVGTFSSDTAREKSAWTGDTGLSSEQILYNFSAEAFMDKWQQDLRDAQRPTGAIPCIIPSTGWGFNSMNGPDWSQPVFEVPKNLYLMTGDKRFLSENYDSLVRYISNLSQMATDNIVSFGLGDWCAPFDGEAVSINMESFKCPVPLTDTAYYYSAVRWAAYFADVLGKKKDKARLSALAKRIKSAFRNEFFRNGKVKVDCQTAIGVILYHKLYESDAEKTALEKSLCDLIKNDGCHLDFGVLGAKAVMNALGAAEKTSIARALVINPTEPSYACWSKLGSGALCECWNGKGSRNHHMFSDISAFFYKYIGGISPDEQYPGFEKINFAPDLTGELKFTKCSLETVRGQVSCNTERLSDGILIKLKIPVGSTAVLRLPSGMFLEENRPLSFPSGTFTVKAIKKQA